MKKALLANAGVFLAVALVAGALDAQIYGQQLEEGSVATGRLERGKTNSWLIMTSPGVEYELEVTDVAAGLDIALEELPGQSDKNEGGKGGGERAVFEGDGTEVTVKVAAKGGSGRYQISLTSLAKPLEVNIPATGILGEGSRNSWEIQAAGGVGYELKVTPENALDVGLKGVPGQPEKEGDRVGTGKDETGSFRGEDKQVTVEVVSIEGSGSYRIELTELPQMLEPGVAQTSTLAEHATDKWQIQTSRDVNYKLEATPAARLNLSLRGLPGGLPDEDEFGKGKPEAVELKGDGTLGTVDVVAEVGSGSYRIALTASLKTLAAGAAQTSTLAKHATDKWQIQTSRDVDYKLEVTPAAQLNLSLRGLPGGLPDEDKGGKGKAETVEFKGDGTPATLGVVSEVGSGSYQIRLTALTKPVVAKTLPLNHRESGHRMKEGERHRWQIRTSPRVNYQLEVAVSSGLGLGLEGLPGKPPVMYTSSQRETIDFQADAELVDFEILAHEGDGTYGIWVTKTKPVVVKPLKVGPLHRGFAREDSVQRWQIQTSQDVEYELKVTVTGKVTLAVEGVPAHPTAIVLRHKDDETAEFRGDGEVVTVDVATERGSGAYEITVTEKKAPTQAAKSLAVGVAETSTLAKHGTDKWQIQTSQGADYKLEVMPATKKLNVSLQGLPGGLPDEDEFGKGKAEAVEFKGDGALVTVNVVSEVGSGAYEITVTEKKAPPQAAKPLAVGVAETSTLAKHGTDKWQIQTSQGADYKLEVMPATKKLNVSLQGLPGGLPDEDEFGKGKAEAVEFKGDGALVTVNVVSEVGSGAYEITVTEKKAPPQAAKPLRVGAGETSTLGKQATDKWQIQTSQGVDYRLEVTPAATQLNVSLQGLPGGLPDQDDFGKGKAETVEFTGDGALVTVGVVSESAGGSYRIALTSLPKSLALGTAATGTLGKGGTHQWQIQTSQGEDYRLEVTPVAPQLNVSLRGLPGLPEKDDFSKGKAETVDFQGNGKLVTIDVVSEGGSGGYRISVETLTACDKGFRYWDQGDGTVLDCATALLWLKDANCMDLKPRSANKKFKGTSAAKVAAALKDGKCGLTDGSSPGDWRLPTLSEFCEGAAKAGTCPPEKAAESLIDSGVQGSPKVANARGKGRWSKGDPFVGVEAAKYWSSTTGRSQSWLWIADLSNGRVEDTFYGTQHFVWPVRDVLGDLGVMGGTTKTPAAPKLTRAQLVRQVIDEELKGFKAKFLYLAPNIPANKLANAAEGHGFDPSDILLMYDNSTRERGLAGFCLSDRKVYTRLGWGEDWLSVKYEDIKKVMPSRQDHFKINEDMEVKVDWSENPKSAEVFARLVERIRDEVLAIAE